MTKKRYPDFKFNSYLSPDTIERVLARHLGTVANGRHMIKISDPAKTILSEVESEIDSAQSIFDFPPEDLPESHFNQLSKEENIARKASQWESVKNLSENDLRKILYFRRFTREFRSPIPFNPELISASEDNFRYYSVDTSKMVELQKVEPYEPTIEVPEDRKIGFIIGYHHLEKPWGNLFMEMFLDQVRFTSESIDFLEIQNADIPTGDISVKSEDEIRRAINDRHITDIIDVHEQLATLNHYMDSDRAKNFDRCFRGGGRKNPNGGEYTLDPFVPLWAIEQYYEGNVYPQLQDAVNEQIKKVEILIRGLSKRAYIKTGT